MKSSCIGNNKKGTSFNHNFPQSRPTFYPELCTHIERKSSCAHQHHTLIHLMAFSFFLFVFLMDIFFLFLQGYFQRQTQGTLGDTQFSLLSHLLPILKSFNVFYT